MPVLLFLACAGVYLSYYPYALNFHHYMTASGEIHDFKPLFYNLFPNYVECRATTRCPLETRSGLMCGTRWWV